MNSILKIALRNVAAHKLKTGIVGGLIFLGVFLIVLGNSFLTSTTESLRRAYSQSITSDIAILKQIDFDFSLFGTWVDTGNLSVPIIPDYENTVEYLENHPQVEELTPVSSGFMMINTGENNPDFWLNGIAIDPESYNRVFDTEDSLIIHEGRMLEPGEEGIVLAKYAVDNLKEYKGLEYHAGDSILLNGYSANGFRIREVPIRGIFEYRYVKGDMYPMLPRTCLVDQQTLNLLNGIRPPVEHKNTALEEDLFGTSLDADDLFGSDFSDSFETLESSSSVNTDLSSLLGDMSQRHELSQVANDDWQWLLVSLKQDDQRYVEAFQKELEKHFQLSFLQITPGYISEPADLADRLLNTDQPEITYLRSLLNPEEQNALEGISLGITPAAEASDTLSDILNRWIGQEGLHKDTPLETYLFSSITRSLREENPEGEENRRLNRLMLEELFPYSLEKGPDYTVSEWWHAAAPMSTTTFAIQLVMNISLMILFVVAVIIIMNTLIISVMERTGEIGTMRAMGGQKSFIFSLFLAETLVISLIFGLLGMIAGSAVILAVGKAGIPAVEGSMLQMIAGGNTLYPVLSPWALLAGLGFMLMTAFLSIIYPVGFALKIQPVEAMREE